MEKDSLVKKVDARKSSFLTKILIAENITSIADCYKGLHACNKWKMVMHYSKDIILFLW